MQIAAVLLMIAGASISAVLIVTRLASAERRARRGRESRRSAPADLAPSILYDILLAAMPDDAALATLRQEGVTGEITRGIDLTSWAEAFARSGSAADCRELLDQAVRLASLRGAVLPLRQYNAILELTFALGFQIDALARLREIYPFDYIDHAKNARPRDADRRAGATTLFAREAYDPVELLQLLGVEGKPTRRGIAGAYRKLAGQYHPDRFHQLGEVEQAQAAARFIEITRAYEKLLSFYRD